MLSKKLKNILRTTSRSQRQEIPISPAQTLQRVEFLFAAIWFGLITGIGEACLLGFKRLFLYQIMFSSPHVVWMAPLADTMIFGFVAISLLGLSWRWPSLASLRIFTFIFASLGFVTLFLTYARFNYYAVILLSVGLAVQTARFISAHPQGFSTVVRGSLGWLVGLVIVLTITVPGWKWIAERRALAKLPVAPPNAPNVLLIVLDTVRAENLSVYGYPRPTSPLLERVGKTGVVFERAISTAPWTLPSHASMFTGRFPFELSVDWLAPLDGTYPTLAEVLSKRGYLTAGFVANLEYCSYETGLNRGFVYYQDYPVSFQELILSSSLTRTLANSHRFRRIIGFHHILGYKAAANVNRDFSEWLSHNDGPRPFFAFLNYYDAHEPYLPPKPFDMTFGTQAGRTKFLRYWGREATRSEKTNMSPDEIQAEVNAYDTSIAYIDYQVKLLLRDLQSRGLLENTLLIITSDHGEQFGNHGFFTHGNSLYLPSVHVPLIISFPPAVPNGVRVVEAVSLRNIPATVLDILQFAEGNRFPGTSLARYWDRRISPGSLAGDVVLSELSGDGVSSKWNGAKKSLLANGKYYIKNADDREELYDIEHDPLQQHNLLRSEEGRRWNEKFRTLINHVVNGVYLR